MINFKRFFLKIFLQVAILCGSVVAQQAGDVQKTVSMQDSTVLAQKEQKSPLFDKKMVQDSNLAQTLSNSDQSANDSLHSFDSPGLRGALRKVKELSEKRRQAAIEKAFLNLPELLRKATAHAKQKYFDVIRSCNIGDFLTIINKRVYISLNDVNNKDTYTNILGAKEYGLFLRAVETIERAISDGSFNALLPQQKTAGLPMPLVNPVMVDEASRNMPSSLSLAQVAGLRLLFTDVWGKLGQGITDQKILDTRKEIYFLTQVLNAVEKQDSFALIKYSVARMRPELKVSTQLLRYAIKGLEEQRKIAEEKGNKKLWYAIRECLSELKQYERVIEVFNSVDKRMQGGALSPEKFQQLFSFIGYVYNYFGQEFLNMYAGKEGLNRYAVMGIDCGLKAGLALWFFNQYHQNFLASFVQMTMTNSKESNLAQVGQPELGTGSIDSLMANMEKGGGPAGQSMPQAMLLGRSIMSDPQNAAWMFSGMQSLPLLYNPVIFNMNFSKTEELSSKVFTSWVYYNCFYNNLFCGPNLWNPDNNAIKAAIQSAYDEGRQWILNFVHVNLTYSNPKLWANLREKTLGVVSPELFTTALDACWPALVHNITASTGLQHVANLKRADYYRLTPGGAFFAAGYTDDELNQNGFNHVDGDWILWRLLNHTTTSIGEFFGRKLAYSEKVRDFFSDCYKGMVARGWVSDEITSLVEQFELGFDIMLDQISIIFLEPGIKQLFVWELKNLRILDFYENDDHVINREMLRKGFGMLWRNHFLSEVDVHELVSLYDAPITQISEDTSLMSADEKKFFEETERIDRTLARFKELVKDRFIGWIGSKAGSWVGSIAAPIIWGGFKLGSWHWDGLKEPSEQSPRWRDRKIHDALDRMSDAAPYRNLAIYPKHMFDFAIDTEHMFDNFAIYTI